MPIVFSNTKGASIRGKDGEEVNDESSFQTGNRFLRIFYEDPRNKFGF